MASQTKRLIIARMSGYTATIEKVTAASMERLSKPFQVIKGDGTNTVENVSDPAGHTPEVTLSIAVAKNDSFINKAQALYLQQLKNPASAGNIVVQSLDDSGAALGQFTLVRAVIQSVKMPDGDTASHTEAMAEIVLQPDALIGELV